MPNENLPVIYTLPLFPLGTVLFPHFPLPLHIFEERYKVMINGCIERNAPFGVVLIREGQESEPSVRPHDVGCVARILQVVRFEDGRMNLVAAGESRFRLLEYMETDPPYLVGRVEEIADRPADEDSVQILMQESVDLFAQYLHLLAQRAGLDDPEVELPDDPALFAFCIAEVVMMPMADKQLLLETTDPLDRLRHVSRWLRVAYIALENSPPEPEPEPEQKVLIAQPLDLQGERFEDYRERGLN